MISKIRRAAAKRLAKRIIGNGQGADRIETRQHEQADHREIRPGQNARPTKGNAMISEAHRLSWAISRMHAEDKALTRASPRCAAIIAALLRSNAASLESSA